MIADIQLVVSLLVVIAAVDVVAARLNIPSSILLVVVGVGLALLPGLPTVQLLDDRSIEDAEQPRARQTDRRC